MIIEKKSTADLMPAEYNPRKDLKPGDQEYEKLKEENRKLQYFLNKEVDEDYIIEYARDVLGMYFPDEDVYYNDVNE